LRVSHRCSIVFRSGDVLGHSITFSFLNKAVVIMPFGPVSEGRASCSASECHSTYWNPMKCISSIPAALMQPHTMMLDYRQNTIVLVLLTRASQPGFPHLS